MDRHDAPGAPTWKQLLELADAYAPRLVRSVLRAASNVVAGADRVAVVDAIRRNDAAAVTEAVDWQKLGTPEIESGLLRSFADAFRQSGRIVAAAVPDSAPFAVTDPRAIEWVREHGAKLVTHLETENGDAVRSFVRASMDRVFAEGLTPDEATDLIYSQIGLTQRYADAVERTLQAAVDAGAANPAALAMREANRLRRARALNIARTESQFAVQGAQTQAWEQLIDRSTILRDEAEEEWLTAEDEAVCEICGPMDGQRVPLGEAFETGTGERVDMPPETHPGCRCSRVLVVGGESYALRGSRFLLVAV